MRDPLVLRRRILFVTESLGVGGTETHLLDLLPHLRSAGFDVAVFCFTEKGTRARRLEYEGIQVTAAPPIGMRKRSFLAPLRILFGQAKLFALIRRLRPDIVHFFLPGPYLAGAPVAMAARVPIRIMSRRSMADYRANWPAAVQIERRLHRHMDAVLGNARAVTEELRVEGVPEHKLHLIYNGVSQTGETVSRSAARQQLDIQPDALVLSAIANLMPYKGHVDLIAALKQIADRLPQPWLLVCAGRDGGSLAEISRIIEECGLALNIRLLGERLDVPLLLAASDIGVLPPTRNEGFSNAILESMAAGLPMVVTNVGGNAEAVCDGETGMVVAPQDKDGLAAAILDLATDPDLRRKMAMLARAKVAEKFSLEASVESYIALYERQLADRASADKATVGTVASD
jgi:glycosyltransferase involved in cell wall biosynthesis